jgi:hypothetical protein
VPGWGGRHTPKGKGYNNPMYEPLWAAAQDLDIPLGMHIATNLLGPGQDFAVEDRNASVTPSRPTPITGCGCLLPT